MLQTRMLSSADPGSIHGGLLALRELASILDPSDGRKAKVRDLLLGQSKADIVRSFKPCLAFVHQFWLQHRPPRLSKPHVMS